MEHIGITYKNSGDDRLCVRALFGYVTTQNGVDCRSKVNAGQIIGCEEVLVPLEGASVSLRTTIAPQLHVNIIAGSVMVNADKISLANGDIENFSNGIEYGSIRFRKVNL